MAKFAGQVAYVIEVESNPGVWSATEVIRMMQGDVLRAASIYQRAERVNSDVTLQHRISLVGDSYLYEHFYELRWVEYAGQKWEVTMVEFTKPRVIVTLGGIWRAS